MAGGLFPEKAFQFNMKCVLFTAALSGGYWFLPAKNKGILLFLFWAPYIAMTYYDYLYDCQNKLAPTPIPFGRYIWLPFKPEGYKEAFKDLSPEQIATMDQVDHVAGWSAAIAGLTLFVMSR
jgi:hypothetical protein